MKEFYCAITILLSVLPAASAAAEYNLYFGGAHSHTSFSDGVMTSEIAYDTARGQGGCDFWFVTDHYQALGPVEDLPGAPAMKEWDYQLVAKEKKMEEGKFLSLLGWEWSDGTFGHMNVLFDATEPPPVLMTGYFDRFVAHWLKKHPDAVTGFNHPDWSAGRGLNNFRDFEFIPRIAKQVVYMEVSFLEEPPFFYRALDKGWWIAPLAAQDNHGPDWCLRPELTAVYATALTEDALREAFLARRFYATLERDLVISFKGNGEMMGSRVTGKKADLEIAVTHEKGKVPKLVRLVSNGGEVLKEWKPEGSEFRAAWEADVAEGSTRWFVVYTEMESSEPKFSISAPIWVKNKI